MTLTPADRPAAGGRAQAERPDRDEQFLGAVEQLLTA